MLGVLKRRWKPKRASNGSNNNNNNNINNGRLVAKPGADPVSIIQTEEKHRVIPSTRQVHPVSEEKAPLVLVGGEMLLPSGGAAYSPPPNICVEGGRIEFIKPPLERSTDTAAGEKADLAKECLEARVLELEAALEAERGAAHRERLVAAKLQRLLSRREGLHRDVERERRLRLDSESRLRDSSTETERCKARLAQLHQEFSRMEESVRCMLQYKSRCDQLKQDKTSLTLAYENRVQQFQSALSKLSQENEALKKQLRALEVAGGGEVQAALLERLRVLELDNCALSREGDQQRRQYERCLDDVANQVVRALLAQKGLREEIGRLQERVGELETQNQALSSLLLQQLAQATPSTASPGTRRSLGSQHTTLFALPGSVLGGRPLSSAESTLCWEDSVVWVPLQRPRSLNLDACCQHRPPLTVGEEGSESPESGNRDEGYSTMSSDVQCATEVPRRGLEDVKEEATDTVMSGALQATSNCDRRKELGDAELMLIPVGMSMSVEACNRHSFPPVCGELFPFQQHIMRSLSDSHLSLKLAPSRAIPSSSSLVVIEKSCHPLRRSKVTSALQQQEDECGGSVGGDWWDTDYVQHWLRLDETRSALQQQMEYDAAELEDWSMEESEMWRKCDSAHVPSIREGKGGVELEEELWNSSYLVDQVLLVDGDKIWPYASSHCLISPGESSWSSAGTSEDCQSLNDGCPNDGSSKRSSAAMSTDSGDSPAVGTDFTRDFYRLVKFESTKSLASTSSRSQADSNGLRRCDVSISMPMSLDREQALQSVLHFIAEQQQYCRSREVADGRPTEFDCEKHDEVSRLVDITELPVLCEGSQKDNEEDHCPNHRRPVSSEMLLNEENSAQSSREVEPIALFSDEKKCTRGIIDTTLRESVTCESVMANGSDLMVQSESESITMEECLSGCDEDIREERDSSVCAGKEVTCSDVVTLCRTLRVDPTRVLRTVPEEDEDNPNPSKMSESLTSSVSTPETVCLRSQSSLSGSPESAQPMVVAGPRSISFHERATSKDVIDELNRMIRKGEEGAEAEPVAMVTNLDTACCCPTGWVHVEREIDFTDPKARANLLDVMLASSRSSSSGSSGSSECGDDLADYHHLHRIHRFRRQKKASATREPLGALRYPVTSPRVSIIGRSDLFVRYGDKEREAVASFDFLEEMSSASLSRASSCDCALERPPTPPPAMGSDSSSCQSPSPTPGEHLSLSDSCGASCSGSERSLDVH